MLTDPSLSQTDVLDLVRGERAYQHADPDTLAHHPHEVGGWIAILGVLVRRAADAWAAAPHLELDPLEDIVSVAAVAVACLEQHGGTLALAWVAALDRVRAQAGYVTPGPRMRAWEPFLEAIRGRVASIAAAAAEESRRAAESLEEYIRNHPEER